MIHNAVAEHNLIPHTADDRGVTPGYQRNWTRAPDLNTAALLRFSARERCRLVGPSFVTVIAMASCCRRHTDILDLQRLGHPMPRSLPFLTSAPLCVIVFVSGSDGTLVLPHRHARAYGECRLVHAPYSEQHRRKRMQRGRVLALKA